jgi:hypothetical protein
MSLLCGERHLLAYFPVGKAASQILLVYSRSITREMSDGTFFGGATM